jgi:hypothetical protein
MSLVALIATGCNRPAIIAYVPAPAMKSPLFDLADVTNRGGIKYLLFASFRRRVCATCIGRLRGQTAR